MVPVKPLEDKFLVFRDLKCFSDHNYYNILKSVRACITTFDLQSIESWWNRRNSVGAV